MTAALEFRGVHKSFDGNPALVDAFFLAESGEVLHVVADTICVHGDTSGAPELMKQLRAGFQKAGVTVRSICEP